MLDPYAVSSIFLNEAMLGCLAPCPGPTVYGSELLGSLKGLLAEGFCDLHVAGTPCVECSVNHKRQHLHRASTGHLCAWLSQCLKLHEPVAVPGSAVQSCKARQSPGTYICILPRHSDSGSVRVRMAEQGHLRGCRPSLRRSSTAIPQHSLRFGAWALMWALALLFLIYRVFEAWALAGPLCIDST